MAERNPNLIPPEAMKSMAQGGTGKPLFSEVFTKVNNAKVKAKKKTKVKANNIRQQKQHARQMKHHTSKHTQMKKY